MWPDVRDWSDFKSALDEALIFTPRTKRGLALIVTAAGAEVLTP